MFGRIALDQVMYGLVKALCSRALKDFARFMERVRNDRVQDDVRRRLFLLR